MVMDNMLVSSSTIVVTLIEVECITLMVAVLFITMCTFSSSVCIVLLVGIV